MADLITTLDLECTDCKLTQGITISCTDRTPGGNDNTIFLINKCEIASYTDTYTDNTIDDITLIGGAVWFPVQARLDTVAWEETVNQQSGFFTQNLTFVVDLIATGASIDAGAQTVLDFINELTNPYNNFVAVFNHNGGFRRVFGLLGATRGLKNGGGTVGTSGTNFEEIGGYTITLSSVSGKPAPVLSINAALPTV